MADKRNFKGVWIPAEVWLDPALSITEKVMLVEIDSLQDAERGCYATNSHFAEFFGLSCSRVSEIISALAAKKILSVEMIRDGKRVAERRIRIITPFGKPNTPFGKGGEPLRETRRTPSEKAEGSNTGSNTESKTSGASAPGKFDPITAKPDNVSHDTWEDWCAYRKEIRKPLTKTSCKQQNALLADHHDADAVIMLSIGNGWTGLFPDKVTSNVHSIKPSRFTNLPPVNAEELRARAAENQRLGVIRANF